jgi:hypothetical protein
LGLRQACGAGKRPLKAVYQSNNSDQTYCR